MSNAGGSSDTFHRSSTASSTLLSGYGASPRFTAKCTQLTLSLSSVRSWTRPLTPLQMTRQRHLKENGVTSRQHGNTGRLPSNVFSYKTASHIVDFITNYATVHGLPQPAAHGGRAIYQRTYIHVNCISLLQMDLALCTRSTLRRVVQTSCSLLIPCFSLSMVPMCPSH